MAQETVSKSRLSFAEPEVRIHLPPAASLLRTPIEPGATRVSEGFPDLLAFESYRYEPLRSALHRHSRPIRRIDARTGRIKGCTNLANDTAGFERTASIRLADRALRAGQSERSASPRGARPSAADGIARLQEATGRRLRGDRARLLATFRRKNPEPNRLI